MRRARGAAALRDRVGRRWYKWRMQAIRTVRSDDVRPVPWRNGGGTTRELLALPAGDDAWRLRVSVADVVADGPFSSFPGVSRWFAVIAGAGVVLDVDGVEHRCSADGEALAFAGAAATRARLIAGPTRDLNLMVRGAVGLLRRVVRGEAFRPGGHACGLYAIDAGRVHGDDDCAGPMPAHALRWWPSAPARLAFDGAGWWLAADPAVAP